MGRGKLQGIISWLTLMGALLIIAACGGGGSSSGDKTTSKTTVSGSVSFPALSSLVAKRVGLTATDTTVAVEVYTLDGVKVTSVNPSYDDSLALAQRIYSYSVPDLTSGVDYVIKVKRGAQVMKKLLEKKDVVAGMLPGQSVDAISSAAVVVASQKLSTSTSKVTLGDTLPTGKTVADLSATISTAIKPALLEGSIAAAVNGGKANLTSDTANYANVFNIVVTAVVENIDPNAVLTGASTLTSNVPIVSVTEGVVSVASQTVTATTASSFVSNTAIIYTPPATEIASTYTTLAKSYLNAQDISNAALNYEKALAIDPADKEANFGAAITSGMMLMEDTDVKTIISKWGGVLPTVNQVIQGTSPIKLPFGNMTSLSLPKTVGKASVSAGSTQNVLAVFAALNNSLPKQKVGFKSLAKELALVPATAPTVSEMQSVIDNVIIPRIDKVLARLAKVEGGGYSFTVTKAMQGNINGVDKVLNDGEFYTLDAALNIFLIPFKIATSYNFDLPSGYTYDTIGQDPLAMINSSTVFTLKSGGAAKMAGALDNAKSAAAKAKLAYDKVVLRTVGTGLFDLASWTAQEKTDFTAGLAKVTAALIGPYDLTSNSGTNTIRIDATKFFTSPLTRANLPTFGYDVPRDATLSAKYGKPIAAEQTLGTAPYTWINTVDSNIVPTSDIPDYTLNGILPNNSAINNIANFTGILPKLDGKLLTENNFNLLYGANQRIYAGTTKFYFGYNATNATTGVTNRAVYKLDTTTGNVAMYCDDITGIPSGMTYQGINYYANPAGIYARLFNGTTSYELRAITQSGTSCSIASTSTKTVTLPSGKTGFTFENFGDNIDPLLHYVSSTTIAPYTTTYYSAVSSATALIALDNTRSLFQIRNGTIAVRSNFENLLEQYTIGADGMTITPSGSFNNISYLPNYGEKKMLVAGGGYYWLFDGLKMIKYAGKPNGTNF